MKKIIIGISAVLISISSIISAYAEEVEGLHEKLNALFIENNFSEEVFERLEKERDERFNAGWDSYYEGLCRSRTAKYDTEEEEYEYRYNSGKPDFNNGVLITLLSTCRYANQYAESGNFKYLFSNNTYWSVFNKRGISDSFDVDNNGQYIHDIEKQLNVTYFTNMNEDSMNFLRNETNINNMLINIGENKISDMKIISLSGNVLCLYIVGDNNEYIMKLYDSDRARHKRLPNIELNTIYKIRDVFNQDNNWVYVSQTKPTYTTEAETLQSQGLLKGTENGLDLLKPLTRAEAATILLRAMGQSTGTTETVQTFSDVPSDKWYYGATQNAYKLGLINGVGDNKFSPDDSVTAVQFSTMVLRAANTGEFDWQQAVNILIEKGIITKEQSETMDFFARCDMAKIIYEAKQNNLF